MLLPLQGELHRFIIPRAMPWAMCSLPPSGRALNAYAYSLIQLEKLEYGNYFWSLSIHPRVSPFLTFVPCLASTSTSFPPSAAGMVTSSSHGVRI